MRNAYQTMNGPWSRPRRLSPRSTAPATSRKTRSSCGALSSIPPTHQNSPRTRAASLARERTELGEVILQSLLFLTVGREVAIAQRGLRLRVMVGRGPDERRDRRGGRRRGRAGARAWTTTWTGRRARRRDDRSRAEERRERVRERVAHHDAILRGEEHLLELGELAVVRLDEDRLQVQERTTDRKDDEVAVDDRAAGSELQERELLLDRRVGLAPGLDLDRPEDRAALRQAQDPELPIIRGVRPARDPRDHVVALTTGRGHRHEEDELALRRARELRGHVVRLDRDGRGPGGEDLLRH